MRSDNTALSLIAIYEYYLIVLSTLVIARATIYNNDNCEIMLRNVSHAFALSLFILYFIRKQFMCINIYIYIDSFVLLLMVFRVNEHVYTM